MINSIIRSKHNYKEYEGLRRYGLQKIYTSRVYIGNSYVHGLASILDIKIQTIF